MGSGRISNYSITIMTEQQIQFRPAERRKARLRIGFSAPSGAGKTYSALLIAKGLTKDLSRVCLIDTENGRGDLYSDLGPYNIITLDAPFSPERYIQAIETAENAGMEVIIIDSISHEWEGPGGCLEMNETLANAKYKGNTWAAWNETTPRHRRFIDRIIASPSHIITTVRNKIDTAMMEDGKIKKVGVKEITREGFEYELTLNFNIDRDTHMVTASKDNTRLFDGADPFVVTENTGDMLLQWSELGVDYKNQLIEQILDVAKKLKKEATQETITYLRGKGNKHLELLLNQYKDMLQKDGEINNEKQDAQ